MKKMTRKDKKSLEKMVMVPYEEFLDNLRDEFLENHSYLNPIDVEEEMDRIASLLATKRFSYYDEARI